MVGGGVFCPYNHLRFSGQFARGPSSSHAQGARCPALLRRSTCQWSSGEKQIRAGFCGNEKQAHTFILKPILDLQSDPKPVLSVPQHIESRVGSGQAWWPDVGARRCAHVLAHLQPPWARMCIDKGWGQHGHGTGSRRPTSTQSAASRRVWCSELRRVGPLSCRDQDEQGLGAWQRPRCWHYSLGGWEGTGWEQRWKFAGQALPPAFG